MKGTDATSVSATDARVWGVIDHSDDEDYFTFTVSRRSRLLGVHPGRPGYRG